MCLALVGLIYLWFNPLDEPDPSLIPGPDGLDPTLIGYCDNTPPISLTEFQRRQDDLAALLHSMRASAFVAEPGASAQYFANLSATYC